MDRSTCHTAERERIKREAWPIARDPNATADHRAWAVLQVVDAHYWRTREHLEGASAATLRKVGGFSVLVPMELNLEGASAATLRKVHGRRYYRGYELDIDVYTRHWLAANAEHFAIPADVMQCLAGLRYGYVPERHDWMPPGFTGYVDPKLRRPENRWPDPAMSDAA